ncbi:3'-5' exonuclease [Candidatus Mycoplasma pogonae]
MWNKYNLQEYVVVDIETTGLDPSRDKITEIGAIKYVNGEEAARFSSLLNTGTSLIPHFILKKTGITNEMVQNAPHPKEVLQKFLDFIGDARIVGYNITNFDQKFLIYNIEKHLSKKISFKTIDVLVLSRKFFSLSNYRLETVSKNLNISNPNAHRALGDCWTTNEVFKSILKIAK